MAWIVAPGDAVDQQLAQPRIDKHHLDKDDADDQIGEVQRHDVDDRRQCVRKRVDRDHPPAPHALQTRHLDIGQCQQVDDRRGVIRSMCAMTISVSVSAGRKVA